MIVPGSASPLFLATAAGGAAGAFQISRSLRFNSADSTQLSKTFSSFTDINTGTISFWIKRSGFGAGVIAAGWDGSVSYSGSIQFNSSDNTLQASMGGGSAYTFKTDAILRDPSSWYHVVVSWDRSATGADKVKIWINGEAQTSSDTGYQSWTSGNCQIWAANNANRIGRGDGDRYTNQLNGYLAEYHYVDGQALDETDFGELDDNNVWQPKEYSGTYGNSGFYLKFDDNSTAAALGNDSSGNDNDWTVNNFSVASGAGNDSLIDTPMNYTASSGNNGGNYATLNPLDFASSGSPSLSNGNLDAQAGSGWQSIAATIGNLTSGKWYWEVKLGGGSGHRTGLSSVARSEASDSQLLGTGDICLNSSDGRVYVDGTEVGTGAGNLSGKTVGIALNLDADSVSFYQNNSLVHTVSSLSSTASWTPVHATRYSAVDNLNFGQRPFAYTPPTDHVSICTTNLPTPAIDDGSTAFDVITASGTAADKTFTMPGGFGPDLVWAKQRNDTSNNALFDVLRGATKRIVSNSTQAEDTQTNQLKSFTSTGFTYGSDIPNNSGQTGVYWCWDAGTSNTTVATNANGTGLPGADCEYRVNTTAGFSIVKVASPTDTQARVHGLGKKPDLIICKSLDSADSWHSYHSAIGYTHYINLNATSAAADNKQFGDQEPTSTYFYVKPNTGSGANKADGMIYYIWTAIEGFSAFGSYTGNGDADGPFVYTGFRVAWLLIKNRTTGGETWTIHDSTRDVDNPAEHRLLPNSDGDESTGTSARFKDLLSNGFKIRGTSGEQNTSGDEYIYAAFAEHPFKTARAR